MKVKLIKNNCCEKISVGTIVEVMPGMEADSADIFNVPCGMCYLCKLPNGSLKYILASNVEIVEGDNIDWEQIRIQAAIAAIQGFASNPHNKCVDASTETLAQWSVGSADALIAELKKEKK